jgi:Uma2 family endonuclease
MTFVRRARVIMLHAELRSHSRAEQIMSMPAVRRHRWTIADVDRLIDQRNGLTPRYELVDGELLVTPAPTGRHQRIILRLALLLQPYLSRHGLGEVRLGPWELRLVTGERYEPDLFVIPSIDGRQPESDSLARPILVCEVLSPGSSRHDRITKRRAFQRNDVPEYWIVDPDTRAFERWHASDERGALIDDRLRWIPADAPDALEIDVAEFFAAVADNAPLP